MGLMATTYSNYTLNALKGSDIHEVLEDVCDNLFHPDPYYQQGGDMVRVGGMSYTCNPYAKRGQRIQNLRLKGRLMDPNKTYKVAGWASVNEPQESQGTKPVWALVERYLGGPGQTPLNAKTLAPQRPQLPELKGVGQNQGWAH